MGHVPPPGADKVVEEAALAYLVAVQTAVGTSHALSVFRVAIMGVIKVALPFGVTSIDVFGVMRDIERRLSR